MDSKKQEKIVELENKIEILMKQVEMQNRLLLQVSDSMKKLENAMVKMEAEVHSTDEKMKKRITGLTPKIRKMMNTENDKSLVKYQDSLEKVVTPCFEDLDSSICQRLDLVDESLRLLLINSIMDQVDME